MLIAVYPWNKFLGNTSKEHAVFTFIPNFYSNIRCSEEAVSDIIYKNNIWPHTTYKIYQ